MQASTDNSEDMEGPISSDKYYHPNPNYSGWCIHVVYPPHPNLTPLIGRTIVNIRPDNIANDKRTEASSTKIPVYDTDAEDVDDNDDNIYSDMMYDNEDDMLNESEYDSAPDELEELTTEEQPTVSSKPLNTTEKTLKESIYCEKSQTSVPSSISASFGEASTTDDITKPQDNPNPRPQIPSKCKKFDLSNILLMLNKDVNEAKGTCISEARKRKLFTDEEEGEDVAYFVNKRKKMEEILKK